MILHFASKNNFLRPDEEGKFLHTWALQRASDSVSLPLRGGPPSLAPCVCWLGHFKDLQPELLVPPSLNQPRPTQDNPPEVQLGSCHSPSQKPKLVSHHLFIFCFLKTEIIMYFVKKAKIFTRLIMEKAEAPDLPPSNTPRSYHPIAATSIFLGHFCCYFSIYYYIIYVI